MIGILKEALELVMKIVDYLKQATNLKEAEIFFYLFFIILLLLIFTWLFKVLRKNYIENEVKENDYHSMAVEALTSLLLNLKSSSHEILLQKMEVASKYLTNSMMTDLIEWGKTGDKSCLKELRKKIERELTSLSFFGKRPLIGVNEHLFVRIGGVLNVIDKGYIIRSLVHASLLIIVSIALIYLLVKWGKMQGFEYLKTLLLLISFSISGVIGASALDNIDRYKLKNVSRKDKTINTIVAIISSMVFIGAILSGGNIVAVLIFLIMTIVSVILEIIIARKFV